MKINTFLTICSLFLSAALLGSNSGSFRVYVDGIWDLFHDGHVQLFSKARNKGQAKALNEPIELVVGVCGTNEEVSAYKRVPIMSLDERTKAILACGLVDQVIYKAPINGPDSNFLEKHHIDLVVHGNDFTEEKKHKYYSHAIQLGKYASVSYAQGISTTQIIKDTVNMRDLHYHRLYTKINENELLTRIICQYGDDPKYLNANARD